MLPLPGYKLVRVAAKVVTGSTLAASAAVMIQCHRDEGFSRSVFFWRKALPIYLHYRLLQVYMEQRHWDDIQQNHEYDRLHHMYAPKVLEIILELKGFYVKLAQLGSTRADFLAPPYLQVASTLQDNAPCKSMNEIQEIIEASYGKPLHQVFESIDATPLGAASIGQAHRAILAGSRQEVAVKVQHPDAEKFFRWDIQTITMFCRLFQPAHVPYLEEIERQFMTEFNYTEEAKNLQTVRDNIAKSPYAHKVVIPKAYLDLCTKEVLVMEFLRGKKLVQAIEDHYQCIALEKHVTLDSLKADQKRLDLERDAQGLDMASGPSEQEMAWFMWQLAWKRRFRKLGRAMYDYSIGLVKPMARTNSLAPTGQEEYQLLNIPAILKLLMDVHGYEIFVNGCFNGDPHPGNILLLDDGRLGLIDYGQVKHISWDTKVRLARLVMAVAHGTKEDIVRAMTQDIQIRTTHMNPYFLEKQAHMMIDCDDRSVTEGMNPQLFLEYLQQLDDIEYIPRDFVMAFRCSLLLRGFSHILHYKFSHAKSWSSFAQDVLRQEDLRQTRRPQA